MALFYFEPDQGVQETWDWETDVLETRNGTESRLSLQPAPSVTQRIALDPVEQETRQRLMVNLTADLTGPSIQPLFGWPGRVTAPALDSATVIQCDAAAMAINDNDYIAFLEPVSGLLLTATVSSTTDTAVTLTAPLGVALTTAWIAYKAFNALLGNDASFNTGSVATSVGINFASYEFPWVQRTGSAAALTTFLGLPVLEREVLAGATDVVEYPRDVTDFGLGRTNVFSRRPGVRQNRNRMRFQVSRVGQDGVDDVDYWRLFLDTVRGRWKAFYISSQLNDLTLASPLVQGGVTLTTVSDNSGFLDQPDFDTFQIEYSDGTISRHQATTVNGTEVTFSPALPNDPKVAQVSRISYLYRARMADRLVWRHESTRSTVSFDITTTRSSG